MEKSLLLYRIFMARNCINTQLLFFDKFSSIIFSLLTARWYRVEVTDSMIVIFSEIKVKTRKNTQPNKTETDKKIWKFLFTVLCFHYLLRIWFYSYLVIWRNQIIFLRLSKFNFWNPDYDPNKIKRLQWRSQSELQGCPIFFTLQF